MTLTEHSTISASGATGAVTVASLARDWAQRAPGQIAMREKDFGIWHEYTWEKAWNTIEEAAFALLALGVQPGDRVSIQSEDRPEWVILDLATVAVRGVTVGFYPTNPQAEVEYLLGDCGACVHLAEDQEQFDKVMAVDRSRLRDIRTILFMEPRGMLGADDDRLLFWDKFLELGRDYRSQHPNAVADCMASARDEISHVLEFEYIIVNENFEAALADLVAVVRAARVSSAQQSVRLAALIDEFR